MKYSARQLLRLSESELADLVGKTSTYYCGKDKALWRAYNVRLSRAYAWPRVRSSKGNAKQRRDRNRAFERSRNSLIREVWERDAKRDRREAMLEAGMF